MLGERLTNLLSLLAQDEFKSLEELASKMNLSSKTLRKLLKELDEKLRSNGAQILSKRGVGYMLEVTEPDTFQAMFLTVEQRQKPPTDAAERVQFIIEQFLKSSDYIKIEEICDAVFVSRKTLAADIKKAEEFFEEFHLSMERKPHYGMRLRGEEFQMRQCITRYQQMKNEKTPGSRLSITPEEHEIAELLLEMLEDEEYHISDVGLNSLVLHIAVSIKRVRCGQYVSLPEEEIGDLIQEEDYRLAKNCAGRISRSMDIQFPEEEIRYLAIHFAGKESGRNLVINSDIQRAVKEMLQEIYEVFQFDVRDDLELIMALGRHLVPLVIRMKYGMRLTNPLLQEVKKRYSLAYAMAVQSCGVLERKFGSILDDNEVSYIALALALSLERNRKQIEKKRVLLVCASGVGTARLMAYRMQESFRDYIDEITICDHRGIGKQDFSQIDYIFTTVPIEEHVPIPICEIKGFLEEDDFPGIRRFLSGAQEGPVLGYYPKSLFFTGIPGETKEEVLHEIIGRISNRVALPRGFEEAVLKREALARTCMGNGVAMPHPCRVMTEETFVSVSTLEKPVKWDESQDVQVVFLVSVSKKKKKKIQNFYSATARLLLDRDSVERLIREKSYETLAILLEQAERSK